MFGFEKLDVWRMSVDFATSIYEHTSKFPDHEKFGLSNQLRRASVSISSNIAEGSGRNSPSDFGRFVSIAYGSLMESVSQLHIAARLKYIDESSLNQLFTQAESIAKMLSRLRSSLKENP